MHVKGALTLARSPMIDEILVLMVLGALTGFAWKLKKQLAQRAANQATRNKVEPNLSQNWEQSGNMTETDYLASVAGQADKGEG
jgi:flagellar basal body-associated protein FliL